MTISADNSPARSNRLTNALVVSLLLGILAGYACHELAPTPETAKTIAGYFSIATDVFLRMIKMIIAPLVFATIVSGITSLGSEGGAVGRIAARSMGWFVSASLVSLGLGMIFANLFAPGRGLQLPLPNADAANTLQTAGFNLKDFITHVFPTSIAQAMSTNEILQILVFAVFFGLALSRLKTSHAKTIAASIDELVHIMLQITNFVMKFAPLGVFAAIAAVITTQGLGVLVTYGKFIATFYFSLAVLWSVLVLVGLLALGRPVLHLIGLLRQPMLLAFSTASSEAAYPKMIEQLTKFGVSERISGFVLPLGYSFNLDGSMMYQAFAALFIAQAYGIELSFTQQLVMLLVMMVTSKGIAGVPRAGLVVVAATLPMFNLPVGGMLLVMGIDQFLDMGRTMTNVIGNGIATAAVAKWEDERGLIEEPSVETATPAVAVAGAAGG
ncbi:dicarboxylate/amino acid:cation symporter [Bradyrhizobium sp. CCBAU 45384]|uniref:dicarboxylate/amino acid:cation symporter n=1 Tax=Bradyrhizobium sp. CCBAU 45384 TaxID=858428 RepID=UPI002306D4C8|nr:dicarboxylate/amino acid:cation symporter [Bradyrhizobium sp. CCBAU 45384]MDA9411500.1 C4-dicarboxylate ABC transporter [Bradyrhizobium sp. CCBAU 45384]